MYKELNGISNARHFHGAKTFSITIFSIMTLSVNSLLVILSIDNIQHE